MQIMDFKTKLAAIVRKNNSLVCVGLDSDLSKIPPHLKNQTDEDDLQFTFNKAIIDATSPFVCAYKPNSAFYENLGAYGINALKKTIHYIKDNYPEIPVILDCKRADIGSTNQGYVEFVYDYLGADAVTVHPYLGKEALKPFLDISDKGVFVLCRTSNPGAGEFQDLQLQMRDKEGISKPLYQILAGHVARDWNYNGNCGLVAAATYPSELKIVRRLIGNMPILIPGVGAQGGDVEKVISAGVDEKGENAVINSSRGIIFASGREDFAQKARQETQKLKDEINKYRLFKS